MFLGQYFANTAPSNARHLTMQVEFVPPRIDRCHALRVRKQRPCQFGNLFARDRWRCFGRADRQDRGVTVSAEHGDNEQVAC